MRKRPNIRVGTKSAAFAFYVVGTLVLFHEVLRDPSTIVYGEFGDLTATIAYWREIVTHGMSPFLPGRLDDFNAPDGMPVQWTLAWASPVSTLVLWLGSMLFGPVAAQTIYLLGGLSLNGWSMFLLVRSVTNEWRAALLAGGVLAWFPWAIATGAWQPDFAHAWPFVLLIWRLHCIQESPTLRNGLLATAALLFTMAWTPYFILFGVVAFAGASVAILLVGAGTLRRRAASLGVVLGGVALAGGVLAFVDRGTESTSVRSYGLGELYDYTSGARQYLTPRQGVFAEIGGTVDDGLWANSGYVGVSVLVLAVFGAVVAWRSRDGALGRLGLVAAATAIVAAAVAAPPTVDVLGVTVTMPSRLVFEVASTWRVLGRLIIVTETGLAVLAAIGVHRLLVERSRGMGVAVFLVVCGVVVVDLAPRPRLFTRLDPPETVQHVAELPTGVVANYPLLPEAQTNMDIRYYQEAMGHPVLNGYPSGSGDEAGALALADLTRSTTLDGLWARGVRYVMVGKPRTITVPTVGLRRVLEDDRYELLRLEERDVAGFATPSTGFGVPEPGWWMEASTGTMSVWSTCTCRLQISLVLGSYGRDRRLHISRDGRSVSLREVPTGASTEVAFEVDAKRSERLELELRATPGPEPIAGPDPRVVGVRLDSISVERARR